MVANQSIHDHFSERWEDVQMTMLQCILNLAQLVQWNLPVPMKTPELHQISGKA